MPQFPEKSLKKVASLAKMMIDVPMMINRRNILICSGFDPLGGAGVLADYQVVADFGFQAFAVPTALVAQNTLGVRSSTSIDAGALHHAMTVLMADIRIDAVKIGLVDNVEVADALRELLDDFEGPVVIDPVLTGGTDERPPMGGADASVYRTLAPIAGVITPNTEEARRLLSESESNLSGLTSSEIAVALAVAWQVNVLQSGGHSEARGTDLLAMPDGTVRTFSPRAVLDDSDVHGTGCHLSSALTALLSDGREVGDAISKAKRYIEYLFTTHQISPGRGRAQFYHDRETSSFAQELLVDRV